MRKRYQLLILLSVLLIIFVTYCAKKADEVSVSVPLDSMLQIPLMPAGHFTSYCSSCHGTGAAGVPQWPAATHGRFNDNLCTYCHKEAAVTPGALPQQPQAGRPPWIPAGHSTSGCTSCHSIGLGGAPQWPSTHINFTENMCIGCHQTTPVTPGAPPPPQPAGGPPWIPAGHSTSGCAGCHSAGLAGAPQWPSSHVNFTENMCTVCHQTTPVTPGTPPVGPPLIPAGHSTSNCAGCHSAGLMGAPLWPANHVGLTENMCTSCHQTAPTVPGTPLSVAPPRIPVFHYWMACTRCHSSGKVNIPQMPTTGVTSHSGFTDAACTTCHAGNVFPSFPPPLIPSNHSTLTLECATCHGFGRAMGPAYPAPIWLTNHMGFTKDMCTWCHQVSQAAPTQPPPAVPPYIPRSHYSIVCANCHSTGQYRAPIWPSTHASYPSDINFCKGCHIQLK